MKPIPHPSGARWQRERNILWLLERWVGTEPPTSAELLAFAHTQKHPWRDSPQRKVFLTNDDTENRLYIRRALSDLRLHGVVVRSRDRRTCQVCRRECHTWGLTRHFSPLRITA